MSDNSSESIIEYFVLSIYPLLLLVIGIVGNFLGFIITSRKKFKKLSTRNLLRFLAVLDTFYLLQIVVDYLTNTFNLDIRLISSIWCKAFTYLNYSICPVSSWSLVIISIERVLSITSSKYTLLFSNKNFKLWVINIVVPSGIPTWARQHSCYLNLQYWPLRPVGHHGRMVCSVIYWWIKWSEILKIFVQ